MVSDVFYSVLVLSGHSVFTSYLSAVFPQTHYYPVKIVESVMLARRALLFREYDLVIVNSPLLDENGLSFALDISRSQNTSILFLSPQEIFSEVEAKVRGSGIFVLKKPLSLPMMNTAVGWLTTTCDKIRMLEKEKIKVEEKMEEIKIINRAKWILINDLRMTEDEAQRFITKEAMDKCITKKEEASIIINTYRPL